MAELGYEIAQNVLHGSLTNMEKEACVWENLEFAVMKRHQLLPWWQASEQGYMHEHGQGLPFDLHLAKRYYDQALELIMLREVACNIGPCKLSMIGFSRRNLGSSEQEATGAIKCSSFSIFAYWVHVIDSLPEVYPKVEAWVEDVLMEEGNATILTLFV
ncbi:hypothetical protein HAX54_018073 [Datura stramonium]|uniref:Uncharacterized protein n=1 Tax=Datura stramonium TaxID=4076 RepID=A0ABS8S357_DATST|nr:hypothetical protein [Datura stramonium]